MAQRKKKKSQAEARFDKLTDLLAGVQAIVHLLDDDLRPAMRLEPGMEAALAQCTNASAVLHGAIRSIEPEIGQTVLRMVDGERRR